ncbi:MAG TPA: tRNA glutamyl-Q(34) synthetase GluQRS [Luteimonas sp.]|nr:tRNA glutamyl-Q(34) synthetase GluQRS [Luteimonas sp.]
MPATPESKHNYYRGRFAPSPTGELHAGSLLAAFGSWLMARHHQGEWLIRIEDLDPPRESPGIAVRQLATLAAFGLVSDRPVQRQSERGELYDRTLKKLIASGEVFPCLCSRSDLEPFGGVHRRCVDQPSGRVRAWRLRVPEQTLAFEDRVRGHFSQDLARDVGDFVLRRADGYWAYQLAVVVDDADQGITDVVRGADLLDSTPRQICLQRLLGIPTPGYAHLPLLIDAGGRKLSKSAASVPIDPQDPLPALRRIYELLGQDPRPLASATRVDATLRIAVDTFDPMNIPNNNIVIDNTDTENNGAQPRTAIPAAQEAPGT